jgi:radical SAM protein with 4Fe4S-binding SPASM domain
VFTNGTLIDEATAQFLYRHGASVVVKRNAMNTAVQDALAGVPGTFERVERGLAALFKAGYPDAEHGLGIQTIICSLNYEKIPQLWSWARRHGIQPYFESMTVQGRASQHPELLVSAADLERMFRRLCELDREAFGIHWTPQPPLAGARCARHLFSMLVRANGDIWPCVGVSIAVGNVRQQRLSEILHTDPVLHDLRNIYTTIKGKCRTCELNGECYGCRGSAFQLTGDYLASDPRCWRNGTEMAG